MALQRDRSVGSDGDGRGRRKGSGCSGGTAVDAAAAYAAAAESAWWISAICDQARAAAGPTASMFDRRRDNDEGGRQALGLRFARNRITHALPVALARDQAGPLIRRGAGPGSMINLSRGYYWLPSSELGEPDPKFVREAERAAYDEHVAGWAMHKPVVRAVRWIQQLSR